MAIILPEPVVAGGPEWSLEMEVRLYRDRANTRPELLRLWQHLASPTPDAPRPTPHS